MPPDLRQAVLDRLATFPSHKAYADHIGCHESVVSRFAKSNPPEPTKKMLTDLLVELLTKYQ